MTQLPELPPRICDTCGRSIGDDEKAFYAGGTHWCSEQCLRAVDNPAGEERPSQPGSPPQEPEHGS